MVKDNIIEMAKENFGDIESQQQQQEEEQDDTSSFDCAICLNYVSSKRRFTNENRCLAHSYCLDCIQNHIQAKLDDYNIAEIKCPALDCNEVLDPLVCRSVLSPRVFEKWCDKLCESTLTQCQKAYCPLQNCSTLILNECEASVTKSNCPVCKRVFCFNCERPWHAGYSCDEARGMTDRNDILFGALMETRRWQRCPVCKHCVELISGCSIIVCRCGIRFCYLCGRSRGAQHDCVCGRLERAETCCRGICCPVIFALIIIIQATMYYFLLLRS
ncbi:hypothetical protein AQUCO_01300932v1 [Aquilegia coerulea]|uniref:RBR-type E3 ubiquitin transferase n=1 Tax=Aquilegia coerulea TaxID=218851 RepID=A0A2G5E450_AQUCA|nr:hypothetical protein AQUCO_01300932v1 [Aquilegia coerulea]